MFKFRDHKIDIGLIFVSVVLVIGILMSFYGATYANLSILLGTFGFGVCFYLKANHGADSKSGQKLSSYGHFMLGLAALITLPQTPEMLRNILEIKKGVDILEKSEKKMIDEIQKLREIQSSMNEYLSNGYKDDILNTFEQYKQQPPKTSPAKKDQHQKSKKELQTSEKQPPSTSGTMGFRSSVSGQASQLKPSIQNRSNIPLSPQDLNAEIAVPNSVKTDRYQQLKEKIQSLVKRPSSTPHLTQENANFIIAQLKNPDFTKSKLESLLQEHLKVERSLEKTIEHKKKDQ